MSWGVTGMNSVLMTMTMTTIMGITMEMIPMRQTNCKKITISGDVMQKNADVSFV